MAKKSPEGAIRLYERNTELSEALYGVVQGFEVTLRNAVHNILGASLGTTWYETFGFLETEQVGAPHQHAGVFGNGVRQRSYL